MVRYSWLHCLMTPKGQTVRRVRETAETARKRLCFTSSFLIYAQNKTSMALKATIFKADLQISDMDRHYYQNHALTIARHPSETDERMMIRVLPLRSTPANR